MDTYQHLEDVDFVDERSVVLDFLFLDGLDRELLFRFAVFRQIDDAEASIRQLLLE